MSALPLDRTIDACIDDIAAGLRTIDECLAAYPEHAAELRPLLEAAFAVNALPRVAETPPSAERRADFMAALSRTPQEAAPRTRRPQFPRIRLAFPSLGLARLVAATGPAAAAVAVVAIAAVLLVGRGATPASASTLTVFAGGVQYETGGQWQALTDGAALKEGAHVRTTADGRAMITFPDGSTTTLDPSTELVLQQVSIATVRDITLDQRSGRLWNDVVPDHRAGAAYIVRTPDAIAQAVGTVFETHIDNGVTSVTTANGLVRVSSGGQQVQVGEGEAVQVKANTPMPAQAEKVTPEAQVSVQAPFAASLIAPDGAATGARPDGVTFSQVTGVATSNPGQGPQAIDLLHVNPGDYTLLLRRFADGSGNLVIHTDSGDVTIPVDGGSDLKVGLRVTTVDGHARVEVLNDTPATASAAVEERAVPSQRSEHAVGVAKQRETEATNRGSGSATGTPTAGATAAAVRREGGSDGEHGDAQATATATGTAAVTERERSTATPSASADSLRQQIVDALASGDAATIREALSQAFGENSRLSSGVRDTLLMALDNDPATQASLEAFLATDTSDVARRVSDLLGTVAPTPVPRGSNSEPGEDDGPQSRATPVPGSRDGRRGSDDDGGGDRQREGGFSLPGLATPTPTASDGTSLLPLPTATPAPRDGEGGGDGGGGDD